MTGSTFTYSTTSQPTRPVLPGVVVYVDLENVSWLTPEHLYHMAHHLSERHGPVRYVRTYVNKNLLVRFAAPLEQPLQIINVDTSSITVDDAITHDAMKALPYSPQTVALVTGDKDFTCLIECIHLHRRTPVVISNAGNISNQLCKTAFRCQGVVYLLKRSGKGNGLTMTLYHYQTWLYVVTGRRLRPEWIKDWLVPRT
jgi:hypothetical protein